MPKPLFHQFWQGDSIDLCSKFRPGTVDCIITDPPFGVDNQSNMATTVDGKANATKIANDETPEIAIKVFNAVMDVLLPRTADNADLYVFTSGQVLKEWLQVADDLGRHGFRRVGHPLIWEKEGPGMGNLDAWGIGYEFIIFLKKGNRKRSMERRNGVLRYPQIRPGDLIHPHEKPLGLLGELIRHSTDPRDFIVDPFGGSGSTVLAARDQGRSAVGIELDPIRHEKAHRRLLTASEAIF
jgi:adenine-specific DNA-methyltransferase